MLLMYALLSIAAMQADSSYNMIFIQYVQREITGIQDIITQFVYTTIVLQILNAKTLLHSL